MPEPSDPLASAAAAANRPLRTSKKPLPPGQVIKRRAAMTKLLANGMDKRTINTAMLQEFGMTKPATEALRKLTLVEWQEETDDMRPHLKQAASRRLHNHILQAGTKGQFQAVASLEKVLMEVQGTAEPMQVNVSVDHRLTTAVLHVLGQTDATMVRELIEGQREFENHTVIPTLGEASDEPEEAPSPE